MHHDPPDPPAAGTGAEPRCARGFPPNQHRFSMVMLDRPITRLEAIARARLVRATDRLRKGTQRTIHTSAQERVGTAIVVTERAATELAGLIESHDVKGSLECAYALAGNPGRSRRGSGGAASATCPGPFGSTSGGPRSGCSAIGTAPKAIA